MAEPADLLESMHELMHLVRQQHARHAAPDGAVSPLEGKVLGYFSRHPGATLSDLVAYAGRDKGQLARLVGGLRERGLLLSEPDPADKRVSRLRPSPEAQQLHAQVQRERRALSARAAAGLSAAEQAQLRALLAKLRAHLSALD